MRSRPRCMARACGDQTKKAKGSPQPRTGYQPLWTIRTYGGPRQNGSSAAASSCSKEPWPSGGSASTPARHSLWPARSQQAASRQGGQSAWPNSCDACPRLASDIYQCPSSNRGRDATQGQKGLHATPIGVSCAVKTPNLSIVTTLARGAALWGSETWPISDHLLKTANGIQSFYIREMLGRKRKLQERWLEWNRTLREARAQLLKKRSPATWPGTIAQQET